MEEVLKFLKEAETYYLATVEGNQPRVRSFGTVNVFEGRMYIQTGKIKDVSKQLHANPKAELCHIGDRHQCGQLKKFDSMTNFENKALKFFITKHWGQVRETEDKEN